MTKILITGANGFVGKRLILYLLNQGHQIYALCRIKGTKVFGQRKLFRHGIPHLPNLHGRRRIGYSVLSGPVSTL